MNYKSLLCVVAMCAASGVAQAFPDYSWYPKAGGEFDSNQYLSNIQLKMPTATSIVIAENASPYLMSEDGDKVACTQVKDLSSMEKGTVAFAFDETNIKANGEWTLTVPEGTLTVDGEANAKLSVSWILKDPNLGLGEYPQITLVSIDPADGSKLPSWGGENLTQVKIKTSDDAAVNYIQWELYDVTDGAKEYIRSGNDNRYDLNRYGNDKDQWADGLFIAVGGDIKLVLDHTYRLDLLFCGIGYDLLTNQYPNPLQISASKELETSVTYIGLTPPQEYAEATYVSVTPDPETFTIDNPENAFFEITYSAPAQPVAFTYPLGAGSGVADAGEWFVTDGFEVDAKGLATNWTFVFKESVVNKAEGTLTCNIQSMDADGRYVKGNADMDFDDINYQISWNCNCNAPALTSVNPAAFAELESLSSITISNATGVTMEVSGAVADKVQIMTRTGEIIAVLDAPAFSDDAKQATWTFDPITKEGAYILIIPASYFILGGAESGYPNNVATFEYYVANGSAAAALDLYPSSVNPEDFAVLESLSDVTLTFDEVTFTLLDGAPLVQVYKLNGPNADFVMTIDPVDGSAFVPNDFYNPTAYTLHFGGITEEGTYQILFPERLFFDGEYDESMGKEGHANPEFTVTYTVGSGNGGNDNPTPGNVEYSLLPTAISPADKSTVEEISTVTLTFEEPLFPMQFLDGSAVNFVPGELYSLTESSEELLQSVDPFDNPASNWKSPTIYDFKFEPVKADGQYKVLVKAGTFGDDPYLGSKGTEGKANPEIVLYYAIGAEVGVEAIVGDSECINVYDINGVQILKNAGLEAAKELKSGLYIINGKKVMIRR